ncbi:DUF4910 domain-containing protein [Falsihalocynthiibacter sp. BN13B15]|uniref:DUF4910 domain-containing protein n=1 Tax=Falsihalocynthiibacter sp. BN13B15 TaxID=3240871 RepID=UPI00350EE85B
MYRRSDERQCCPWGIDFLVRCFYCSKYGQYPEYDTKADCFDALPQDCLISLSCSHCPIGSCGFRK